MNRSRALTLLALSFVAVRLCAQPPDGAPHVSAAQAQASGAYNVVFHLSSTTPLPPGASVLCKAKVTPNLPAGQGSNAQPVASAQGAAGQCSVDLPFSWPVDQVSSGARLSYVIEAVSARGEVIRRVMQSGVAVPAPPAAGTARVRVTVGL